jgi:dihydroxy-acid dehydratase
MPYSDAHVLMQDGGPIALVQDGDMISVDAEVRTIDMDVSEAELSTRRNSWKAPPLKATQGTLYKYIKNVSTASLGCITDA